MREVDDHAVFEGQALAFVDGDAVGQGQGELQTRPLLDPLVAHFYRPDDDPGRVVSEEGWTCVLRDVDYHVAHRSGRQ